MQCNAYVYVERLFQLWPVDCVGTTRVSGKTWLWHFVYMANIVGVQQQTVMHHHRSNHRFHVSIFKRRWKKKSNLFSLDSFDLTSLAGKSYQVKRGNSSYTFGICNAAQEPCLEKSGACQTDNGQSVSLGLFNDNLQFNDTGAPFLVYPSGSVCKGVQEQWTTRIEFICTEQEADEGPIIVENSHCAFVIHYRTPLVCRKDVSRQFLFFILN